MCRIAGFLGPPARLSLLLNETPHGLTDQSRNAQQMHDSTVAGDGWGIGWHLPEAGPTPGLLKSILPLWSDENGKTVPHAILSGSIVVHIRYASPSIETCFTNTPLFVLDDHLFTVNGEIQPWPGPVSRAMRGLLDDDHEADLRGSTDGEMLGALWRTHFRRTQGRDIAGALRSALGQTRDLALEHEGNVMTNVIIGARDCIVAVRYAESGDPNTMYYTSGTGRWQGGSLVASEPLDDGPGWNEMEANTLLIIDRQGVHLEPLALAELQHSRQRQSA